MQANILIDSHARARLVDFGLSTIKAEFEGSYYSSTVGGALRWRAPELLSILGDDVSPTLTFACDIYSYGGITLQVGIIIPVDSCCHPSCCASDFVWENPLS
jgi:serine/threonine protein kinase